MGLELGSPSTNGRASIGRFTTKATPIRTKVSSLFFQRRFWICFLGCMMLAALLRQSYVSRERFFRTNDIVGIDGSDLDADGDAGTQGGLAGTTGLGTGEETGKMKRKRVKAVFNATLGFGEIFMPVMPHRFDQMDTAALLGHLTGISITVTPGVYPEDIRRVTVPLGDYSPNEHGVLGAWRAHLNIMREIVQRNLSTALIFESDADWDVRFKNQLSLMAESMPSGGTEDTPYGLDWEMIWLGVSGNGWDRSRLRPAMALWRDDSLPRREDMVGYVKDTYEAYGIEGEDQRIMAPAWGPVCTGSYAVTYAGAYRILYELGYNELYGPTDLELGRLGRDSKLKAMVVIPPLTSQYRTGSAADSEINAYGGKFEGNEQGKSENHIVKSARKALKTLYRQQSSSEDVDKSRKTVRGSTNV